MNTNKTRILLAVMWHMIMLVLLSADGIVRTSLLKPGLYWGIVVVTMFTFAHVVLNAALSFVQF